MSIEADEATDSNAPVLTDLARVGDDRAEKLRAAGFETVADVADATLDELKEVSGVGQTLAPRLKGSAQGHLQAARSDTTERTDVPSQTTVRADQPSPSRDPRRLVILAGDGLWEERDAEEVFPLIEQAIKRFSLELTDGDVIGFPEYSHGAEMVRTWVEQKVRKGDLVGTQPFYVDESLTSTDDPHNKDWYKAYEDRNRRMLEWADVCLVVEDGKFINSTLKQNPEIQPATVKTFIEADDDFLWTLPGVDEGRANALRDAGLTSVRKVADASAEEVHDVLSDISEDMAQNIYEEAHYETFGVAPPSSDHHSWEDELSGSQEDDWYDGNAAPTSDPERGPEHVWVADQERKEPEEYRYEGGEPGDNTLL